MPGFQSVPVELGGLLTQWGLTEASMAMLGMLVGLSVELLKKHMGVSGKQILMASAGCGIAWGVLFYAPDWLMSIRSGLLSALFASGGMQILKTLAGKVGEDSVQKANAAPSQPAGVDTKPGN